MSQSSAKKERLPVIDFYYLVTGYVTTNDAGKIVAVPGTLDTVRNQVLFSEDVRDKNKLLAWQSNKNGVIKGLKTKKFEQRGLEFRGIGKKPRKLYIPPPERVIRFPSTRWRWITCSTLLGHFIPSAAILKRRMWLVLRNEKWHKPALE